MLHHGDDIVLGPHHGDDVGDKRYAREPLRKRVQGDAAKQLGPKQRGAGGRVREGREPRVGEPVGFCDANF
jgi:hypothetical protein